jgi:hypothetical protein
MSLIPALNDRQLTLIQLSLVCALPVSILLFGIGWRVLKG